MKIEKPMTENERKNGNLLYRYLMKNDIVTKEEMFKVLGWDSKKDRQLRDLLSEIGKRVPLISYSSGKGYKIAKNESDLQEVEHAWAELSSRCEELNKRIKPLIKFRDSYKFKGEEKWKKSN